MDGIADMGGTEGWGPTHPPRADEPVFAGTLAGPGVRVDAALASGCPD